MAKTPPPSGKGAFYWWTLYPANLWQPFKWSRDHPAAHSGIDIGMAIGTPLVCPEDGTYMGGTQEPWGGQVNILVQWPDGPHVLTFLHLSEITPHRTGEAIVGGTLIGRSGQPPSAQYGHGAHLHFEVTKGSLAPYEQYSPTRPTQSNYPIDGKSFLEQLKANGGPISRIDKTPGSGTVQKLAGSVPGFMQLAQSLDGALSFQQTGDIIVGGIPGMTVDTGVSNFFPNLRAAMLRFWFVLIGLLLLGFAIWNLAAKPALAASEPVVSGAAQLAPLLA